MTNDQTSANWAQVMREAQAANSQESARNHPKIQL